LKPTYIHTNAKRKKNTQVIYRLVTGGPFEIADEVNQGRSSHLLIIEALHHHYVITDLFGRSIIVGKA